MGDEHDLTDHMPYLRAVIDTLTAAGVEVSDWWVDYNALREASIMLRHADRDLYAIWSAVHSWSITTVDGDGVINLTFTPARLGAVPSPVAVTAWVQAWPIECGGDISEETASVDKQLAAYLPEADHG